MKRAVCILIAQDGLFLSVSRRHQPHTCGLPGGKVDPGENEFEAVIRETAEEIGLTVTQLELMPIYSAACLGDVNYWTTTFLYEPEFPIDITKLKAEEGITIGWVSAYDLQHKSPFGDYNDGLLATWWDYTEHEMNEELDAFDAESVPPPAAEVVRRETL